ncbi:MAG: DnaD domain protein [Clostridia bacterium]|nr:DnaD domain protein [Clostridia bacterium]
MEYLKIFVSFAEVIEPLNDSERGRLFVAMLKYAERGELPELKGNERFVWPIAKQSIDRTRDENERLRANGARGGRPRKAKETNENQQKPNESQKDKDNDNPSGDDEEDCSAAEETRARIGKAYIELFGRKATPEELSELEWRISRFRQDLELGEEALRLAAAYGASAPAMYAEKLLQNWYARGIRTMDDYAMREEM